MLLDRPDFVTLEPLDWPSSKDFDVIENKFDGWWLQLLLDGLEWRIYSRSGMLKKYGSLRIPWKRTLLHGEYLYGTEWSKDRPDLYDTLQIFGAEEIEGVDVKGLSLEVTRDMLVDVIARLEGEDIRQGVSLVEQFPIKEAARIWHEHVVLQKYEGLVFKNSQAPWGTGFARMKASCTMDYICIGYRSSDSDRYAGNGIRSILGGLYVEGELTQVCKVSGMDDELRRDCYANPEKYLGRVFEAEGKKVSKRGALRHPNFIRWRNDKPEKDCKWPVT